MRSLAICCAVAMVAAAPGRAGTAPRAADGTRLLDALESAQLAVVGQVVEPRRVDLHGYTAGLLVESQLAGEAIEAGATLRIAWEELSRSRTPRFDEGDRILVGLEPLPGSSLWRQRFPEPGAMTGVLAVGQEGQAFLRSPSLGGLRILEHYLALSPEDRRGVAGVRHLAALAAQAEIPLALSAARGLAAADHPDRSLDSSSATLVVRALVRGDATPEFQSVLLGWIEARHPEPLRPALEAAISGEEVAPPILFVAMGLLDGELSGGRVAFLMEQGSTEYRTAAVRFAPASQADRLASLARGDREPEVRAAAITRLLALRREAALEEVLETLSDPDPSVRMAAARGLGSLGAVAVPRLRDVVEGWPQPAPQAAVWALQLIATPEAVAALKEIAGTHPDAATRTLAEIAIGKPLGDSH